MLKLYDYFRSSAAFRVRIVLHLKNIPFDAIPIHLLNEGGEQFFPEYQKINPQSLVPAIDDQSFILTQSLSIIDYLQQKYPHPSIYPADLQLRQLAYSFALSIACDIHPLNNLRVLLYLQQELQITQAQKTAWYHHWISEGLSALEKSVKKFPDSLYCFGDDISIADVCLIPQLFNARRFDCDLSTYPRLLQIEEHCKKHAAFITAWPKEGSPA